jgi:hypothetical protein
MMILYKRRSEINRLIKEVRIEAAKKDKKIDTIDPILKKGRNLYPLMSRDELLDYCSTALRIILSEETSSIQQTTLLTHI